MKLRVLIMLFLVISASGLVASGESTGNELLTIQGSEVPLYLSYPGQFFLLNNGNVHMRGKITVYHDQYAGHPEFSGTVVTTSNCNISQEGSMNCWGEFWPTGDADSLFITGSWEGRFDSSFNGIYRATARGIGPLDGYRFFIEAQYPSGSLITKVLSQEE